MVKWLPKLSTVNIHKSLHADVLIQLLSFPVQWGIITNILFTLTFALSSEVV